MRRSLARQFRIGFAASFIAVSFVGMGTAWGAEDSCEPGFTPEEQPAKPAPKKTPTRTSKKAGVAAAPNTTTKTKRSQMFQLSDLLNTDAATSVILKHPFLVANAAEKALAALTFIKPVRSADALYGVKPTMVYPVMSGHELADGRRVVGNEESIDALVQYIASIARGDRVGKSLGFLGPAGTGKTEILQVIDRVMHNLSKSNEKYREFSYRFKNLHTIPFLKNMFKFDKKTGEPLYPYIDPDMPRSPFTLLRADIQDQVLASVLPSIRSQHSMVMSKGWKKPEPKTKAIIRAILEHKFPEIADGQISINDLSADEYLAAISEYVVIVPKGLLQRNSDSNDTQIIRVQTENPNYESLFAQPDLYRHAFYSGGFAKDLGIDYNGQVFQQDGGLLLIDELYRNPPAFLNLLLELKQNRIVQTDYGDPVELDSVIVWTSNDESIDVAKQDMALKASIDRDQPRAMRLLLAPTQIESTSLFQVEVNRFLQRAYNSTAITPLNFNEVYPAPDQLGKTHSAYGRYSLYYQPDDSTRLHIAPMTLNYMSWVAAASRFVVDWSKINKFASEINLVTRDASLLTDPIVRLRIVIGDREIAGAERLELYKLSQLLQEGSSGISSRDIETWFKNAINIGIKSGKGTLTPRMMDQALEEAMLSGEIKVPNHEIRAYWQTLRAYIKTEILLPKLSADVKAIISGDADKAFRVYDEIEREFLELGQNPEANRVMPDDGSQPIIINKERLNAVRKVYRDKFGKDFSPNFLLRNLAGARKGNLSRDPQLLEAIRLFLSEQDAKTDDYISAFDAFYAQRTQDPAIAERVGHIEVRLSQFGYDQESFKEAVALVSQLRLLNGEQGRKKDSRN